MEGSPERYRILDHPADGKFRAFGASLEEAFANAALAMASLMWDWAKVERRVEYPVAVQGKDLEQLLYLFLEEALYLIDAQSFLLAGVEDLVIEVPAEKGTAAAGPPPFRLTARFVGDDRPALYEFRGDVKAVTYSEMKIEACACGPGPWMLQVVVDM